VWVGVRTLQRLAAYQAVEMRSLGGRCRRRLEEEERAAAALRAALVERQVRAPRPGPWPLRRAARLPPPDSVVLPAMLAMPTRSRVPLHLPCARQAVGSSASAEAAELRRRLALAEAAAGEAEARAGELAARAVAAAAELERAREQVGAGAARGAP
jgi:hypothetical protein